MPARPFSRNGRGSSNPNIGRSFARKNKAAREEAQADADANPAMQDAQTALHSDNVRTYESLGLKFTDPGRGQDLKATCPFCKSESFHVEHKEGFFHCKKCGKSGNKYTFLQLYFQLRRDKTTAAQYRSLVANRGLKSDAFSNADLAYDPSTKQWLMPVRNERESMVNIRRWNKVTNLNMGLAGCSAHLFGLDKVHAAEIIYVCEGEWDAIAMNWLLDAIDKKDSVAIAVPGASVFKSEWCQFFRDKEIVFLYDNDQPGKEGQARAAEVLRTHGHPRSMHAVVWPDSYPDKFDIRDLVNGGLKKPRATFRSLRRMLEEQPLHSKKSYSVVRTKFSEVLDDFRAQVYMSPEMEDALLLIFAVTLSNRVLDDPYCPLWLFVVGPAGSGKTLLLQSIGDTDLTNYQSSMNAKTLVSGYRGGEGSEDGSLLPEIIGKTLVIKDFTEILNLPATEQDEFFSLLRGAYDGQVSRIYGNKIRRVYPAPGSKHATCHFTLLAGVTNEIHASNRSDMGERFLKYQMVQDHHNPIDNLRAAMDNTLKGRIPEIELRASACSFIENKERGDAPLPELSEAIQNQIMGLAQIAAVTRAVVNRKQGELLVRPTAEIATRLCKQLVRLAQSLAFTLDKKKVDQKVYKVVQRVAFDTCYGFHRDVILAVASYGHAGILREELAREAVMSGVKAHRILEDLHELGAVTFDIDGDDLVEFNVRKKPGRPTYRWYLSDMMTELFRIAKVNLPKPRYKPSGRRKGGLRKIQQTVHEETAKRKAAEKKANEKPDLPYAPPTKTVTGRRRSKRT